MTKEQYLKNLDSPSAPVDVVLDTDTYNEIDDQFALAYMLCNGDRLKVKGICAAPFYNSNSDSPEDGMEKSYQEIHKILKMMHRESLSDIVFKGSRSYMESCEVPVPSEAAQFLADLCNGYSPEHPLYIVAIGTITNVASALLMNPRMKENTVIVWLGGHAYHWGNTNEFNMCQDVHAARVLFGCGVPLVQLPCLGVVDHFATTRYELEHWLLGKSELCTYLAQNTIQYMNRRFCKEGQKETPWSKIIWDVTAVAWLLNDDHRFMLDRLVHSPIPEYDNRYAFDDNRHLIKYVHVVLRDELFADLFEKLTENP